MKKLLLILAIFFGSLGTISSQTAVYVDYTNGAVGYSSGTSYYMHKAYKAAVNYGAVHPRLLFETPYRGYVCILRARKPNGVFIFTAGYRYSTREGAERRAIKEMNNIGIYSGYVVAGSFYGR